MLDSNAILDTVGLATILEKNKNSKVNSEMDPNSQHFSSRKLKHKLEFSLS